MAVVPQGGHGQGLPASPSPSVEGHELRAMFDELDTDGSGELEKDEVLVMATRFGLDLSDEAVDAAMREMDGDGNGAVDYEEFCRWFRRQSAKENSAARSLQQRLRTHLSSLRGERPALQAAVIYAFNLIDVDGSGRLDREEVIFAAKKLGVDVPTDAAAAALFNEMERGPTGEVGFFAFRRWYLSAVDAGVITPLLPEGSQSQSPDDVLATTERRLTSLVGHHDSMKKRIERQTKRKERRRMVEAPDIRHEFAQRVGKSWDAAEWHERLPYHTPRESHRSARQQRALTASRRLGSQQARLAAVDAGKALTPQPPMRRITPGERHLQEATCKRPPTVAVPIRSPREEELRPWTVPYFATANDGIAHARPARTLPLSPAGERSSNQSRAQQKQAHLGLHAHLQPRPPTAPDQLLRQSTSSGSHCGSWKAEKVLSPSRQPAQQLIRQIPLATDGRMAVSPYPIGKPYGQWRSARTTAVFSARSRASPRNHAVATAAAQADVGTRGHSVSSAKVSAVEKLNESRNIRSGRVPQDRDRRHQPADANTASALRVLRSRVGIDIRDRPANGWAAAGSGRHNASSRGPPRCAPLSPGQDGAVHVSVSRAERIFAATQSVLAETQMDKKMLQVQMATMIGGGIGSVTGPTNRRLSF